MAEQQYRRAMAGYEETLGGAHSCCVDAKHCTGVMLLRQTLPLEALALLSRAHEQRCAYYGHRHPQSLDTLFRIGQAHYTASLWRNQASAPESLRESLRVLGGALAGMDR
ncbi:hypothetical protein B484DRAFT_425414 [Ochromonadaceae sp. CCMP2298]|nr:hypothetical protein B484DRAFT_425414 [Ochromonadaceae sp. CCMP2298]